MNLAHWPDAPNCPVCGAKISPAASIDTIKREPTSFREFLATTLAAAGTVLTFALIAKFYSAVLVAYLALFLMGGLGVTLGVAGLVTQRVYLRGFEIRGFAAVLCATGALVLGSMMIWIVADKYFSRAWQWVEGFLSR